MRPRKPIDEDSMMEIEHRMKTAKTRADFQRYQSVWLRAKFGFTSTDIAIAVGLGVQAVKINHWRYFNEGINALAGTGRGGRRYSILTLEEEDVLLEGFIKQAQTGGILVVSDIRREYERVAKREAALSTVYRMLDRHGWRKIVPRRHHPKGSPEAIEEFKKNSLPSSRKSNRR